MGFAKKFLTRVPIVSYAKPTNKGVVLPRGERFRRNDESSVLRTVFTPQYFLVERSSDYDFEGGASVTISSPFDPHNPSPNHGPRFHDFETACKHEVLRKMEKREEGLKIRRVWNHLHTSSFAQKHLFMGGENRIL